MSDLADAESGVRGSASLPRHSVRVLNPFNGKQTITDLIALGVSRREAELNVRRAVVEHCGSTACLRSWRRAS